MAAVNQDATIHGEEKFHKALSTSELLSVHVRISCGFRNNNYAYTYKPACMYN